MSECKRSECVDTMRLLANWLVIIIHSWGFSAYIPDWRITTDGSFVAWSVDAARIAMPTLFCLSGYLLFNGYSMSRFSGKLKSRVFRLVIPYMLWNLVYLGLFFVLWKLREVENDHIALKGLFPWCVENLFSLTSDPACPPMWYVRAIFVYILLSPLLFSITKLRYGWFLALSLLLLWGYYTMWSGLDSCSWTTYPYYSILSFCLGAFIADSRNKLSIEMISRRLWNVPVLLLLGAVGVVGCKMLVGRNGGTVNPSGIMGFYVSILRVLQIGLICGVSIIIAKLESWRKFARVFYKSAFFLYALHYGLLTILEPCIGRVLQKTSSSFIIHCGLSVAVIIGFCCCVGISHFCWLFINRICPRFGAMLDGRSQTFVKYHKG